MNSASRPHRLPKPAVQLVSTASKSFRAAEAEDSTEAMPLLPTASRSQSAPCRSKPSTRGNRPVLPCQPRPSPFCREAPEASGLALRHPGHGHWRTGSPRAFTVSLDSWLRSELRSKPSPQTTWTSSTCPAASKFRRITHGVFLLLSLPLSSLPKSFWEYLPRACGPCSAGWPCSEITPWRFRTCGG